MMSTELHSCLTWAYARIYNAAVVVVTLMAFPVYVPLQTWREAHALTASGRVHWTVGALSVITSTAASLAICLCGVALVALPSLLIYAVIFAD